MANKARILMVTAIAVMSGAFLIWKGQVTVSAGEMVVYKTATCGCCGKWIDHIKASGIKVKVREVADVAPYKKKHSIPADLGSCHTAVIDGYFVEGHVPAEDVKRLLQEKKPIAGLTVPGMPIGSPGMEMGDQKEAYQVIAVSKKGERSVFSRH